MFSMATRPTRECERLATKLGPRNLSAAAIFFFFAGSSSFEPRDVGDRCCTTRLSLTTTPSRPAAVLPALAWCRLPVPVCWE